MRSQRLSFLLVGDGPDECLVEEIPAAVFGGRRHAVHDAYFLNRSVCRMHLFRKESDFEAFERVMLEAHLRQPIRILSYCVVVIALACGTAGELDGSRIRSFDHEGIRPSAGFQTAMFLGFQTAMFLGLSDSHVSRGFQTAMFLGLSGFQRLSDSHVSGLSDSQGFQTAMFLVGFQTGLQTAMFLVGFPDSQAFRHPSFS